MSYDNSSVQEVLTELIKQTVSGQIQGPILGSVISYNSSDQTADLRPVVAGPPILRSVPVLWSGAQDGALTFLLQVGDICLIIPLGSDHSKWTSSNSVGQDPPSERSNNLSDVVALPVVYSRGSPRPATAIGTVPVLSGSQIYLGSSIASDYAALASKVDQMLTLIIAVLTAQITIFAQHTHDSTQPAAPGNYSGAPKSSDVWPPAPVLVPTGSIKIHAE